MPVSIVEFNPGAQTPDREQWRYTARPEWSSTGESLWMRLSKFSHCNRVSVAELARLFARQDDREALTGIDLRCIAAWATESIATRLEISAEDVLASFCCAERHALTMRALQRVALLRSLPSGGLSRGVVSVAGRRTLPAPRCAAQNRVRSMRCGHSLCPRRPACPESAALHGLPLRLGSDAGTSPREMRPPGRSRGRADAAMGGLCKRVRFYQRPDPARPENRSICQRSNVITGHTGKRRRPSASLYDVQPAV